MVPLALVNSPSKGIQPPSFEGYPSPADLTRLRATHNHSDCFIFATIADTIQRLWMRPQRLNQLLISLDVPDARRLAPPAVLHAW